MDNMDGRMAAHRLGIPTIYTIAVLELAAEKGLIELPAGNCELQQTSFFISTGDSRHCFGTRQRTTREES